MQKTFHKYEDPGHGWLKVKRTDILHLPITKFSFQRNDCVYLEEDLDMSTFLNDLDKRGVEYKIVYHHTDRESKIRNYPEFQRIDDLC